MQPLLPTVSAQRSRRLLKGGSRCGGCPSLRGLGQLILRPPTSEGAMCQHPGPEQKAGWPSGPPSVKRGGLVARQDGNL